ncbi:MAG: RimK-like protein [Gammaproteobacteria bacterium]|nr:RimK-like protein [Gammaproteobacteria bacterium]
MVALQLQHADIPYVRLNREQLANYNLTLDPLIPKLSIRGPFDSCCIGPDLYSVWFRQPVFLRNTPSTLLSPKEQLEKSQWMAFLRSLSVFQNAAWMNFPTATYLAESKPYQLLMAAGCGFQVPTTLVTNDVCCIQDSFPGTLAIKSLDTVLLRDHDDDLFTFTTLSHSNDLNEETVKAVPLLAQRALDPKIDIRVTVVDKEVFSVRVLSRESGISGDWRLLDKSDLEFQDIVLNSETTERCQRLMHQLGLSFATIDLAETPEGTFFIEINPTGEWGWLSTVDRPIDHSIASWLGNPPKMTHK